MQVNMHEAKSRLSELVAAALRGEEVVIARDGRPVARITPLAASASTDVRERRTRALAELAAARPSGPQAMPESIRAEREYNPERRQWHAHPPS